MHSGAASGTVPSCDAEPAAEQQFPWPPSRPGQPPCTATLCFCLRDCSGTSYEWKRAMSVLRGPAALAERRVPEALPGRGGRQAVLPEASNALPFVALQLAHLVDGHWLSPLGSCEESCCERGAQMSLGGPAFSSVEYVLRRGIAGTFCSSVCRVLRNPKLSSTAAALIHIHTRDAQRLQLL